MGRLTIAVMAIAYAAAAHAAARPLQLSGFVDAEGAISVLSRGDTVDPYFAMQALLIAHDNGLDTRALAARWVAWLLPRQKPDATFDRFCKRGPVWAPCKTADADDSLLAFWLRVTQMVPGDEKIAASRRASAETLARLFDPARGVYLVSPVYQTALLMDNLEVWSHAPGASELARAINAQFWDAARGTYRYVTPGDAEAPNFYPHKVVQVFPLLFGFPIPVEAGGHYRRWMRAHRAEWLKQVEHDFAWGAIAVIAWRQGDVASVRCWLRETLPARGGPHWTATDEAASEVFAAKGVLPAISTASCR
ncbi:MAG TPA: hypothetical protein VM051_09385 [Usitatibacter sp.]|nr:hypothetical protein [Usitatibacter sp.]